MRQDCTVAYKGNFVSHSTSKVHRVSDKDEISSGVFKDPQSYQVLQQSSLGLGRKSARQERAALVSQPSHEVLLFSGFGHQKVPLAVCQHVHEAGIVSRALQLSLWRHHD